MQMSMQVIVLPYIFQNLALNSKSVIITKCWDGEISSFTCHVVIFSAVDSSQRNSHVWTLWSLDIDFTVWCPSCWAVPGGVPSSTGREWTRGGERRGAAVWCSVDSRDPALHPAYHSFVLIDVTAQVRLWTPWALPGTGPELTKCEWPRPLRGLWQSPWEHWRGEDTKQSSPSHWKQLKIWFHQIAINLVKQALANVSQASSLLSTKKWFFYFKTN